MNAGTLRRLVVNPLIVKDGLSLVRSWRAPVVIAVYVGLLGLFAALTFSLQLGGGAPRPYGFAGVASNVFTTLALVQLALVCLFAPALAAGAVSGERERQTLDVLLVSCVPTFSIVWGKMVASVAFVLLLMTSALPLFATVFLFGGIDAQQFVVAHLITLTTALALGAVSLFLSTMLRRTLAATVVAYGLTFAVTAASWLVGTSLLSSGHIRMSQVLLYLNPIQAVLIILRGGDAIPYGLTSQAVLVLPTGPIFVSRPGVLPATLTIEPWLATIAVELALVALGVLGTALLLRERRGLGRG